jgi:hypothetical protein
MYNMNPILPSEKKDSGQLHDTSEEMQESIYFEQHEFNITDGGEFLDDNIRMKDQPYRKATSNGNE